MKILILFIEFIVNKLFESKESKRQRAIITKHVDKKVIKKLKREKAELELDNARKSALLEQQRAQITFLTERSPWWHKIFI